MDGGEPDIPIYKMIECKGPTNTRVYTVAVYFRSVIMSVNCWHFYFNLVLFRGDRLAKAQGHSIQQAEMNAAKLALEKKSDWTLKLPQNVQINGKAARQSQVQTRLREIILPSVTRRFVCFVISSPSTPCALEIPPCADQHRCQKKDHPKNR